MKQGSRDIEAILKVKSSEEAKAKALAMSKEITKEDRNDLSSITLEKINRNLNQLGESK